MKRIKLSFAGLVIDFVDRELAIKRVLDWAEKGTYPVQVVFGPEGCGKTAWLRQSVSLLRELGFDVMYIDVIHRYFEASTDVREIVEKLSEATAESIGVAQLRLATLAVDLAKYLIEKRRKKIAVLVDDVFQGIGLDKAAIYVKELLGLIEYPPKSYDKIVVIVATSEGLSRREIGRHRWANILPMWNMSREGFRELYELLPGEKPSFDDIWRVAGGNPGLLAEFYKAEWSIDRVMDMIIREKKLREFISSLSEFERELLSLAIEDPDVLMSREGIPLLRKLVDLNLVVDELYPRDQWFWVGEVPPERDLDLGIGRDVAWQTPLHREAVRRALRQL